MSRLGRRPRAAAALAVLIGTLAVVIAPAPAGAHGLGGLEPTSYESRILRVRPAVPGLDVRLVALGEELEIDNGTGREVQVVAGGRVVLRVPDGTVVAIHDHATHWHEDDPTPAAVRRAPDREHVVRRWTVSLRAAGTPVEVDGEVRWVPGPSPWPWLALALVVGAAIVVAGRRVGARRHVLCGALAIVIGAQVVHVVGAWGAATEPAGDRLVASVYSLGGLALAVAALVAVVRRGVAAAAPLALLAGIALALAGGLADITALTRSQLPFTGPDWLDRLAVALTLGGGAGIAVVAARALRTDRPDTGRGDDARAEPPSGDDAVPAAVRARYRDPS